MLKYFIEVANSRPTNENLHYYVCEYNDSFIIHTNQYIDKWEINDWLYSTKYGENPIHKKKPKFKYTITKNG